VSHGCIMWVPVLRCKFLQSKYQFMYISCVFPFLCFGKNSTSNSCVFFLFLYFAFLQSKQTRRGCGRVEAEEPASSLAESEIERGDEEASRPPHWHGESMMCRQPRLRIVYFQGCKILGVISEVSWDVGRGVRILIKKLITELACKLWDEFTKTN
jgi:hypothetical protein